MNPPTETDVSLPEAFCLPSPDAGTPVLSNHKPLHVKMPPLCVLMLGCSHVKFINLTSFMAFTGVCNVHVIGFALVNQSRIL